MIDFADYFPKARAIIEKGELRMYINNLRYATTIIFAALHIDLLGSLHDISL